MSPMVRSAFGLFGFTSRVIRRAWGTSSDSKPLGRQLEGEGAEAYEVAARPGQAGDEAGRDRVAYAEDNRDRQGCVFRCDCRDAALGHDHVDLAADEVGGQGGQPIIAVLRRAVFNRYVLSLDIAGVAETETERGQT